MANESTQRLTERTEGRALELAQLGALAPYLVVLLAFLASLMFYVWSRVDARALTAAIDDAMVEMAQLEVERDRLVLEMATRRSLDSLTTAAGALALVPAPVTVLPEPKRGAP